MRCFLRLASHIPLFLHFFQQPLLIPPHLPDLYTLNFLRAQQSDLFFFYFHFPGWLHPSSCSGQKSWSCPWPLFFLMYLVLPSIYLRILILSHNLHCSLLDPKHHHLSAGILKLSTNWSPCFSPCLHHLFCVKHNSKSDVKLWVRSSYSSALKHLIASHFTPGLSQNSYLI